MKYYIEPFTRHYADFKERARRKECWMFSLFNLIASWLMIAADYAVFHRLPPQYGLPRLRPTSASIELQESSVINAVAM